MTPRQEKMYNKDGVELDLSILDKDSGEDEFQESTVDQILLDFESLLDSDDEVIFPVV